MFSILNEIKDNSPFRTTSVVSSSIGTAGGIYVLVAITGYLSFGDNVVGNIVSQCTFLCCRHIVNLLTSSRRCPFSIVYYWQSGDRRLSHVLIPSTSASLQSIGRRRAQLAAKQDPVSYTHLTLPTIYSV